MSQPILKKDTQHCEKKHNTLFHLIHRHKGKSENIYI